MSSLLILLVKARRSCPKFSYSLIVRILYLSEINFFIRKEGVIFAMRDTTQVSPQLFRFILVIIKTGIRLGFFVWVYLEISI